MTQKSTRSFGNQAFAKRFVLFVLIIFSSTAMQATRLYAQNVIIDGVKNVISLGV